VSKTVLFIMFVLSVPLATSNGQTVREPAFSVAAGPYWFDMSGTGRNEFVAVSVDWPLANRWLLVGGSLTLANPKEGAAQITGGPRTFVSFVEAQMQLQYPNTKLHPYLGLGVGPAIYLTQRRSRGIESSVSGLVGLRMDVSQRIALSLAGRVRCFDQIDDHGCSASAGQVEIGMSIRRR